MGLGVVGEKLDLLSRLVILSVINNCKGWDWMLELTRELMDIKWGVNFRTMGSERAIFDVY